jgi:hypothetical protein
MHDALWAGVNLKLDHADFYFEQIGRALVTPDRTRMSVVLEASGADVSHEKRPFYAHLASFLMMTRSVPDVIQWCFGKDKMFDAKSRRPWFKGLLIDEQTRRTTFSRKFEKSYQKLSSHPLSEARNIIVHRVGVADVEVRIRGRYGVVHIGNAVKRAPAAESRPVVTGDDPGEQFAATLPPLPVVPNFSNLLIDGSRPLFDECRAYLALAHDVVAEGRNIAQAVHGNLVVSVPH